ncbi:MAG TPA: citrate/2-methylcitrate synthase [Polyangiaceae bacterium]|jgi:hypothetical protein
MKELELPTRVARAEWGDNTFFGLRVGADMAGRDSFMSALGLAAGGPRVSAEDARVLDDVAVCFTAADPRIWPLKIARLASAYGSSRLAYACAHMALEGGMIGPNPAAPAAQLFVDFRRALGDDATDAQIDVEVERHLASGGRFFGFGVPYRPIDERVVALEKSLRERGRTDGPHWKTMRAIERALVARKKLPVNIVGAGAAVELDLGFTPDQIGVLMTMAASLSFMANAVEGAAQRPELLQKLPLETVEYVGRGARLSPRAEAKRTLDSEAPALAQPAFR